MVCCQYVEQVTNSLHEAKPYKSSDVTELHEKRSRYIK